MGVPFKIYATKCRLKIFAIVKENHEQHIKSVKLSYTETSYLGLMLFILYLTAWPWRIRPQRILTGYLSWVTNKTIWRKSFLPIKNIINLSHQIIWEIWISWFCEPRKIQAYNDRFNVWTFWNSWKITIFVNLFFLLLFVYK
jgi:hypothetical protein